MAKRLSITLHGETANDIANSGDIPIWNQDTTGTATIALNIDGGQTGSIPYQTTANNTSMIFPGKVNQVLTIDSTGTPTWANNIATSIIGGQSGQVLYQSSPNTTTTTNSGKPYQALILDGDGHPTWMDIVSNITNNITGGAPGQLVYQSTANNTVFVDNGNPGQILSVNVSGNPVWINSIDTVTNIHGGKTGQVLYQADTSKTTTTTTGTPGQVLVLNQSGIPEWSDITVANIISSNNTTSSSGGTATGIFALKANTTGVCNDAHGYSSLSSNTTGSGNSSYGFMALRSNTRGEYNTAIGKYALQNNTTGAGNITIAPCSSTGEYAPIYNVTNENDRLCIGSTKITNSYVHAPWTTSADERDQINVTELKYGLDLILKLNPINYQFSKTRGGTITNGPKRYGFAAQELLLAEGDNVVIVDQEDVDNLKITESNLIAVLVKAVQELQAEIVILKNHNNIN